VRRDVLRLSLPVAGSVSLIPDGEDRFAAGDVADGQVQKIYWPDARLVFTRNAAGDVTGYEWRDAASDRTTLSARRIGP